MDTTTPTGRAMGHMVCRRGRHPVHAQSHLGMCVGTRMLSESTTTHDTAFVAANRHGEQRSIKGLVFRRTCAMVSHVW